MLDIGQEIGVFPGSSEVAIFAIEIFAIGYCAQLILRSLISRGFTDSSCGFEALPLKA